MKKLFFLSTAIIALILSSCGKDNEPTPKPTPEVKIDVPAVTLPSSDVGTSKVTFTSNVAWSISLSDTKAIPSWFSVDKTSGEPGTVTITLTITEANPSSTEPRSGYIKIKAGDASGAITITQPASAKVAVTGVTLNKTTAMLSIGGTETLTATVAPENATDKSVTWLSNKPEVATVIGGVVTAVANGTAIITVTTVDGAKTATCTVTVEKYFPDANFRAELVTLGLVEAAGDIDPNNATNKDKFTSITRLSIADKSIVSLQGIEYFTALTNLNCPDNQLTTLDLSKNTALTQMSCNENKLTELDMSKNTALIRLNCPGNQLRKLDISKNTALTALTCEGNQLAELDVSQNTVLTELTCNDNQLTELDVSQNTALTKLTCIGNQLTTFDVSKNTKLTTLGCDNNQLTTLDVSKNTALTVLDCNNNELATLDVSKNTALITLACYGNKLTALDITPFAKLNVKYLYCGKQSGQLTLTLTSSQNVTWKAGAKDAEWNANVTTKVSSDAGGNIDDWTPGN